MTSPRMIDVKVERDLTTKGHADFWSVHPIWSDVDNPIGSGWLVRGERLARRLEAALRAGAAVAVSRMLCVERSTVWHYASTGRLPADGRMFDRPVWSVATVNAYIAGMSEQGRRRYEQRKARAAEDAA